MLWNTRRFNRIFRPDGRALIVAMDHGIVKGAYPGLETPAGMIGQVVAAGADAVLTSYGMARQFARELGPVGLILRVDGGVTHLASTEGPGRLFFGVEEALRLGADAVALCAYPGTDREGATLENLARAAGQAHAWNLAVLSEMVPGDFDSPPQYRTLESIRLSVRVAAELGADLVKTPYVDGFEAVTGSCYVPVVILGGARRGSEREMLAEIRASLDAGGAGVAIGRNVFQAQDPGAMTAAIAAMVHEDASVEQAQAILQGHRSR
jgi:DhnA family fructose-bisphosphate aldolase class Ia